MFSPHQAERLARKLYNEDDSEDVAESAGLPSLPERIGQYRILELIGVGGMGAVYKAQQKHPNRLVALKVLRSGITSRSARRRFDFEVEVLGRLDHPAIARIFEASSGTPETADAPFFAMEYVPDAQRITEYADSGNLTFRQRLQLFVKVCDAVHHGHQKGIIHRDLKPGNILVDSSGAPKVIDFGVARATDSDRAATTLHTDAAQLVGTIEYMSPEQCSGNSRDLDTRSDVYSLGVVLYELLCGRLPHDLNDSSIPEATRAIAERPPALPSGIRRSLRGDLEAILLKALAKDRAGRYQSAAELSADIQRHLNGQPIEARPPRVWTHLVRWLERHPILATAGVCMLMLCGTLIATRIEVWYLRDKPYDVILSEDGRTARLISVGGRELKRWQSKVRNGIGFAKFVELEGEAGGDELVIIGRRPDHGHDHALSLCAYDAGGNGETPIWRDYVKREDLPPSLLARERTEQTFGVVCATVAEVFMSNPGPEVVAVHHIGAFSESAVRVVSAQTGDLLYQTWHDGNLSSIAWLPKPGHLVLAGLNAEAEGIERGFAPAPTGKADHPPIVLALQPRLGHIATDYLISDTAVMDDTVAWYRCLLPADLAQSFALVAVERGLPGDPVGQTVRVNIVYEDTMAVAMLLDGDGNEIPGRRVLVGGWNQDPPIPDHQVLQLGDLPPIAP